MNLVAALGMAKFDLSYTPAARPPRSTMRLVAPLAALACYAAVGWCVVAVVTAVVGDPVTNYLVSTHNNAVLAVSRALLRLRCLLAQSPSRLSLQAVPLALYTKAGILKDAALACT